MKTKELKMNIKDGRGTGVAGGLEGGAASAYFELNVRYCECN